jgi:hypothetical protein
VRQKTVRRLLATETSNRVIDHQIFVAYSCVTRQTQLFVGYAEKERRMDKQDKQETREEALKQLTPEQLQAVSGGIGVNSPRRGRTAN